MSESERAWKKSMQQFVKFNMIGLLNTAIDFIMFIVLYGMGVYYLLAQVLAYGAGMLNSLLMNSRFTFADGQGRGSRAGLPDKATSLRFLGWNGLVLGLSILLLAALREWFGGVELLAKVIVTPVSVGINFYGSKKWVFASRSAQGEES